MLGGQTASECFVRSSKEPAIDDDCSVDEDSPANAHVRGHRMQYRSMRQYERQRDASDEEYRSHKMAKVDSSRRVVGREVVDARTSGADRVGQWCENEYCSWYSYMSVTGLAHFDRQTDRRAAASSCRTERTTGL